MGGAAYLIWLGLKALRSAGASFIADTDRHDATFLSIYKQGALVGLLNPKVAIFFLAFLPQFVVVGAGPVPAQLFLHGLLIIAVAGLIEPPLVIAGGKLVSRLRANERIGLWMERTLGAVLVSLGVRLALENK